MTWRDEPATLKQRMALENMHKRLGWSVVGIRDMTKGQASEAFERAKKANDEKTSRFETFDEWGEHDR